jgi:zinc transport system substrate-binding protein
MPFIFNRLSKPRLILRLDIINMTRLTILLAAIGLAIIATSCTENYASTDGDLDGSATVRVVASMYPLGYFTSQIGGDRVQVDEVVPSGGDAHDFEPTPGDLRKIAGADMIVYNGLGFESWIDAVLDAGDAPDIAVQASSSSVARHFESNDIAKDSLDDHDGIDPHIESNDIAKDSHDDHEDIDPHIWLDPVLAITQARAITEGLVKADPDGSAVYLANSDDLVDRLTGLDGLFTSRLGSCSRDTFITSHDSFNYMAARYGINAVGIAGLNPESEPSPRTLADLSDAISDSGIGYVLVNPIDSDRLSDTLARETDVESLPMHTLENLTSNQKESGETYFSLMEQNLTSLMTALECEQ